MDGEYKQRINMELTESEADRLLNLVLSMDKTSQDSPQQDQSSMSSMLFARLVGAFPNLIENDNAMSFLEQHGYGRSEGNTDHTEFEGVAKDKALIVWDRVSLKRIEQHLQATRSHIKTEIAKLDSRRKFIESCYIKQVLNERGGQLNERRRLSEIWRRLGTDMDYQLVKERKRQLKSEDAKVLGEIATLSKSAQANPVLNGYW
ncbi:hypothetical protein ACFLW2_04385 [Chloroflexota bacterium]